VETSPWQARASQRSLPFQVKLLRTLDLQNSTVGVALFDEDLRCAGINELLSSLSGIPQRNSIGQTVEDLFGKQPAFFQQAFPFANEKRCSSRNLRVFLPSSKNGFGHECIADVFPLQSLSKTLRWTGATLTTMPKHLNNPFDSSSGKRLLKNKKKQKQVDCPGFEKAYAPVFYSTCCLLERSMALRRRVSEMRLAANLLQNDLRPNHIHLQRLFDELKPAHDRSTISQDGPDSTLGPLSEREMEVVYLLAEGKSNKQIATQLQLSTRTIETYRARVMEKLGLHSLADLIRYLIRHEIIEP
jgi:DNA-binding CsgD family transcriptional regulator